MRGFVKGWNGKCLRDKISEYGTYMASTVILKNELYITQSSEYNVSRNKILSTSFGSANYLQRDIFFKKIVKVLAKLMVEIIYSRLTCKTVTHL